MKFLLYGNGKRLLLELIVVIGLILFSTSPLYAAQANLAWDANNPAPDGYRVFSRLAGGNYNYTSPAWSGSASTCTVNNLADSTTYYFVVRAFVGTNESQSSNEVPFRYEPPVYQITASAGANGSISPSGTVNVTQGANRSFTISPNTGYRVADVLVNGKSVGAVSAYTFSNVTANQSIAASFASNSYQITATAGTNGTISPSGQITAVHGSSQTFTIKPDTNCYIANVVANGQTLGPVATYTFSNITGNCTIAATFGVQTHTITASAGTGGTITPSGSISVNPGGSQSFTIKPLEQYRIKDVLIDGVSVGNVSTYSFSAVAKNHSIAATFESSTNDNEPGSKKVVFGNAPDADFPGTVQDTYININNSVYATQARLNTYTWPANTPANAVLMKFDLSRLPAGAQIRSATLTLYQVEAGGDAAYDVSVHKVINRNPVLSAANGNTYDGTNNWTASNKSYNNIPLAQGDIAAAQDVNSLDRTSGYKNWDVTRMVQDWVGNSASNYGLMLNSSAAAGADSYRFFAASEAVDPAMRPFLEITYDEPGSVTALFGNAPDADFPGTVQDTYININNSVYATQARLSTYTWPANTPANAVLMKFDLSRLPAGAQIESATLTLYQVEAGGDAAYNVSVHKVINRNPVLSAANGNTYDGTNNWTASNKSYNNIPLAQGDIAPAQDVNSLDRTSGYKNWDVTRMVQDWVGNSASNYGLMLNSSAAAGADSYRFFAASEAVEAARRPMLEVTYTVK